MDNIINIKLKNGHMTIVLDKFFPTSAKNLRILLEAVDEDAPAKITAIMGEPSSWALDLPLRGETYETSFYKKD